MLLRAESERIALTFRHEARKWRAIQPSADLDAETQRGIRAYGQKQGNIFDQLTNEANVYLAVVEKHWTGALGTEEFDDLSGHIADTHVGFEDADNLY